MEIFKEVYIPGELWGEVSRGRIVEAPNQSTHDIKHALVLPLKISFKYYILSIFTNQLRFKVSNLITPKTLRRFRSLCFIPC